MNYSESYARTLITRVQWTWARPTFLFRMNT